MRRTLRKGFLSALSVALLATGGALLCRQWIESVGPKTESGQSETPLSVRRAPEPANAVQGHFPAQSVERHAFSQDGKALFDLLVARYADRDGARQSAVLFPKEAQALASTPTGMRYEVWQAAAEVIARKAPDEALFLSWWDDGQRLHFLTGKEAWLRKPGMKTFSNPVWQALKDTLPLASDEESRRSAQMARWLTLDSDKAIAEIAAHFGPSQPVYLLVDNDLLLHLAEFGAYGGAPLKLEAQNIPAGGDLHGDIARVKRWAGETGDGNYLAQKEGTYYRVWSTRDPNTKNTLLVRLLPFVDSLKQLPEGVSLVYQSHWGGFLSVYKIDGPRPPP
ncbi:hydroxylamine oxidation protein HaoB [Candidatus Methylomicrobium oryzae]|uniref:hydroxylamine oxidation protein HaoB n=1 Tax=Candidatus Methylomicrobium oryzae TaxID=2802053 RepID=UPI001924DC8F|nr:hydroxylamine oxidation protein HaoB [Methylomicrobium sp. RS1]MBL1264376.1 hydroxylamine oxidation protein HaoB [Methylomicrobium sp. RS1]